MSDKEIDYILWICKRLVFKYDEDESILRNVEEILSKHEKELSFYRHTHKNIDKYIDISIQNLTEIRKCYANSVSNASQEYDNSKLELANIDFENLDISSVLT